MSISGCSFDHTPSDSSFNEPTMNPFDDKYCVSMSEKGKIIENPFSGYHTPRIVAALTNPSPQAVASAYQLLEDRPCCSSKDTIFLAATDRMDDASDCYVIVMTDLGYKVVPRTKAFRKDGRFRSLRQALTTKARLGDKILVNPFDGSDSEDDDDSVEPYEKASPQDTAEAYRTLAVSKNSNEDSVYAAALERIYQAEEAYLTVLTNMGYTVVPSTSGPRDEGFFRYPPKQVRQRSFGLHFGRRAGKDEK